MSYTSSGIYLGSYADIAGAKAQLERERACHHETACWLPPDFWPRRYRCNDCGKQVGSLDELRNSSLPKTEP